MLTTDPCSAVCAGVSVLLAPLYLWPLTDLLRRACDCSAHGFYRSVETESFGLPQYRYQFFFCRCMGRWVVSVVSMPPCTRIPPELKQAPGRGLRLRRTFRDSDAAVDVAFQWAQENQSRLAGGEKIEFY